MSSAIRTALRILFFRADSEELQQLDRRHLLIGLLSTWIVGVGRWWEDPRAGLWQHLGVGSVVYIFVLSAFLWLILWPLAPKRWSYFQLLAFISLTSPPALLYAIPVRHGLDLQTAQTVRLWFLAIVAGWRVLLLGFYLYRGAGFSGPRAVISTIFPLIMVVVTLTGLNLEKVVFEFMGGVRPEDRSVNDGAYSTLVMLTLLCELLFIPLFITYAAMSVNAVIIRRREKRQGAESGPRPEPATRN